MRNPLIVDLWKIGRFKKRPTGQLMIRVFSYEGAFGLYFETANHGACLGIQTPWT
jgi:hypothetical protein